MSDSLQDASVSPSDVPTPESIHADASVPTSMQSEATAPEAVAVTVDAASPENSDLNSSRPEGVAEAGAEVPATSPAPPVKSPAPVVATVSATLLSLRDKALEAIQFRRRAQLEKIIALAEKKKSIGNDEVEKLLHISDSTAGRYLSILVREGKLQRTGLAQATRYSPSVGSNGAV